VELGQPIVIEPAIEEVDEHDEARQKNMNDDDDFDEAALEPEDEGVDATTVRRSNRRTKPPSRFENAVILGLQLGQFLNTDNSWNSLIPLKPLPETVYLEQDVSQPTFLSRQELSTFLSRQELHKLKELCFIDKMNEERDPDNEIEKILRHRHTRYVRRPPGKDT
jgi:hypothetical protein